MKVIITEPKEVNATKLIVSAGVRYWEDSTINGVDDEAGDLIPCRNGDCWCPEIDIDKGIVINWEKGKTANIHFKVCDMFSCNIVTEDGKIIGGIDEDYVPNIMSPGGSGYGDYIIMKVDDEGLIDGWDANLINEILNIND